MEKEPAVSTRRGTGPPYGEVINTYEGPTPQKKMLVLMALFQYSGWIGEIDPNTTYPRDLEVDYVRVYTKAAT